MSSEKDETILEQRRKPRVTVPDHVDVQDAHSGNTLGRLVNLSEDGLMLVGSACIGPGAVFQLRLALMKDNQRFELVVGAESLWCQDANDSGAHWTGFQIIDISPEHREIIDSVVNN
jgi:hypothetical protein